MKTFKLWCLVLLVLEILRYSKPKWNWTKHKPYVWIMGHNVSLHQCGLVLTYSGFIECCMWYVMSPTMHNRLSHWCTNGRTQLVHYLIMVVLIAQMVVMLIGRIMILLSYDKIFNTVLCVIFSYHIQISISCNGFMTTSSNGNTFWVTGHLCGEFTGDRWIPRTKASDAELWCFLWSQ